MRSDTTQSKFWLTVVIPSYRGEVWVGDALQSIASQDSRGLEILLIDGGPTPAARTAAEPFGDRLCLRIIAREDLGSWHAKANLGVQLARAAHVSLLCVDDIWLPNRVAAARRWIDSNNGAILHLGPSSIVDRHEAPLGIWRCPLSHSRELTRTMLLERLLVQNFIASPAPVFRRDAWLASGGLDESLWYTADWDMWIKLSLAGSTYYHPEITTGFRIHGDSLSMTGMRSSLEFERQMLRVVERYLPRLGPESAVIERIARASIAMNCAMGRAWTGERRHLWAAAAQVLRLGPRGLRRFLRDTRLIERVVPRLRARSRGAF